MVKNGKAKNAGIGFIGLRMKNPKKKIVKIDALLEDFYGTPGRKTAHEDPMESLVLTILSQNTSDVNSFRAFESLKKRFPGKDGTVDWASVAKADQADVADAVRMGGLAQQKSERIGNILGWIESEYGDYNIDKICEMPPLEVIEIFTRHKGIGVKTISVVLAFSCGADLFPVDTHVNRVSGRLGFVSEKSPAEKTFRIMSDLVPENRSFSLHLNIIRLGREICNARKPKCEICPLRKECQYAKKNLKE